MKRKVFFSIMFLVIMLSPVAAQASDESSPPLDISIEFSQMLAPTFELEYLISDAIGVKAGLGISLLNIKMFTYNLMFVYHLNLPSDWFQLDIEAGLPLAYVDFFEDKVADWDPQADGPFAGWLLGGSVLASYKFDERTSLGLRLGASAQLEHREYTGWGEPGFMWVVAAVFNF